MANSRDLNLLQFATRMAEPMGELFQMDGEIQPTWVIEGSSGLTVIGTPWRNDYEKEQMVGAVKEKMRQEKASRYVQLAEVWTLEADDLPESIKLGGRVSSHPKRREAFMAMAEDKQGNIVHIVRFINREGDNVTLSEPQVREFKDIETTGLMTHLLED